MKKIFQFALMSALVCGLSMSVASCKDDDKDDATVPSASAEEQAATTQKYWNVVSQLVGTAAITDDYQDKTFEPTIGEPETEGSLTHVVQVNDMKSASQRFANLVGATGIDENTPSYNYDDPDVGTLTYTRMANAEALAIVDVNIKQVPHLKRIVYRAVSDENKSFGDMKAYYRFGDIVKCGSGNDTEYWICVRPAFTYEGKEDSHWVCVTHLPTENYKAVEYKDNNFYVPTKLGTDKVNMQNFAEMLWAICQPGKWHDVASNYHTDGKFFGFDGVPIFEDFHAKYLRYHNQYFWQNVQKGWKDLDELDVLDNLGKVLGMDWKNLQTMMGGANGTGRAYVHLLYNGYSWWTWASSPNLTLYEATYTNGDGDKRNMHNAAYSEPKKDVSGFTHTFDCREMPGKKEHYKEFWNNDDDYRFVIRHATGKELNGGQKLEPTAAISPAYAKDVYRYYAKYQAEAERHGDIAPSGPEITPDADDADIAYDRRGFYDIGDVVEDGNGIRWFCVQPSTFGQNDFPADEQYAYFISLEKKAVGENLEHIAQTKDMAAQILWDLSYIYHDYQTVVKEPENRTYKRVKNIEQECVINFDELFGVRDSMRILNNKKDTVACDFISTLYTDNRGERYVLRLLYDFTVVNAGMRDWVWRFWDSYSADLNRLMKFEDLNEQSLINRYNEDRWVYRPWYDYVKNLETKTNIGPRKEVEPIIPITRFIYQKGRTAPKGDVPANMYREPIIPFAVKRVADKGHPSYSFEDGTAYTHVSLAQTILDDYQDEPIEFMYMMPFNYHQYIKGGILLNGDNKYDFKRNNRP